MHLLPTNGAGGQGIGGFYLCYGASRFFFWPRLFVASAIYEPMGEPWRLWGEGGEVGLQVPILHQVRRDQREPGPSY